jgi:hypothetical protein
MLNQKIWRARAYADLVRFTGHDPVTEILAKLRPGVRWTRN